jgi:hypothetical protein
MTQNNDNAVGSKRQTASQINKKRNSPAQEIVLDRRVSDDIIEQQKLCFPCYAFPLFWRALMQEPPYIFVREPASDF